jgi:hypothetical protein
MVDGTLTYKRAIINANNPIGRVGLWGCVDETETEWSAGLGVGRWRLDRREHQGQAESVGQRIDGRQGQALLAIQEPVNGVHADA